MEYQKIKNLRDKTDGQLSKLRTRKCVEVRDDRYNMVGTAQAVKSNSVQ